jgi:glycosyltransferase involved in cell wall biosynthesis
VKVSIIGPTYPYRGGIAHYTTLLTQHLLAARHDAYLYSYTRQYPRWLFPGTSDRDPSATPLRVPCEYLLDPLDPRSWWRVARRIERDAPDVVVLQWWVPYWAPSLLVISQLVKRRTQARLVFICHNVLPHEGGGRLRQWIARVVLQHGDVLVVHSEQDRQMAQRLLPRADVRRTAHPTYDVFDRLQSTTDRDTLRQRLGLEHKHVLLFFGFVRPYKGLAYLLDALPCVLQGIPNAHLLVVGEFWGSKQPYMDQIARTGMQQHVTIVDRYVPNEEVGPYFAAADVAVLPYVSATQSGVVQLAFGFGVPVITTRVGGLHEAVAHERTGLLVPPQDAHALAAAITRFFHDNLGPSMRVAIAAEQQAGRFAWEALVRLIEDIRLLDAQTLVKR